MNRAHFLRLLAAVYAAAFASHYAQQSVLFGSAGVTPARAQLEQRRGGLDAWAAFPSAVWLLDAAGLSADAAIDVIALTGAALAAALAVGAIAPRPLTSAALPFLYLSLVNAGRASSFELPADGLLLETGWAAALWTLGASPVAPLLLLRWVAAKTAWTAALAGLTPLRAAWFGATGIGASIAAGAAAVGSLVLAPLALAPAPAARAAAAAGLLAAACIGAPHPVRGWPLALRCVLAVPLLARGTGGGGDAPAGPPPPLRTAAAAASILFTAVPVTQLAVDLLRYTVDPATGARVPAASDAAVRAAAARAAPPVVAVAAAALAVALGMDLWRSLVATHGDPFVAAPPTRRPPSAGRARLPSAGATPAALAGAAAFLVFAAGAVDVLALAAGRGSAPSCAACGAPRAFVAAGKLTRAARPWRAAGGVLPAAPGTGLALQVRWECGDNDDEDGHGWTTLPAEDARSVASPLAAVAAALHTPRLAPALAAATPDNWRHASAWVYHAAALLVGEAGGDLVAALGGGVHAQPPCAARVVDAATSAPLTHALTPADVAPDVDVDSDVALELASHLLGPLVIYDKKSGLPALVASIAAAPRALGATGAGVIGVGLAVAGVAAGLRPPGRLRARGRVVKRD